MRTRKKPQAPTGTATLGAARSRGASINPLLSTSFVTYDRYIEEVYVKQYTEPFHLDAPPEVVFAYLTDLIESGGRCCLQDDLCRPEDHQRRRFHVWAQAAGEALRNRSRRSNRNDEQ